MIGAIIGDFCGSTYEFNNVKLNVKKEDIDLFPKGSFFTDDTILTCSIADSLMNNKDIAQNLKAFYKMYSDSEYGYGGRFLEWCLSSSYEPYNSWGNGSGIRVSSVGWLFENITRVKIEAIKTAEVTHNHPEGIKGAVVIAECIKMLIDGHTKENVKKHVMNVHDYDLNRTLEEIRPTYKFEVSCQKSVPEAIICFLESTSFEDSIRNSIWLGGDSDSIAAMCGSLSAAYYKIIPDYIANKVLGELKQIPHLYNIYNQFLERIQKN